MNSSGILKTANRGCDERARTDAGLGRGRLTDGWGLPPPEKICGSSKERTHGPVVGSTVREPTRRGKEE